MRSPLSARPWTVIAPLRAGSRPTMALKRSTCRRRSARRRHVGAVRDAHADVVEGRAPVVDDGDVVERQLLGRLGGRARHHGERSASTIREVS